MGEVLIGIVCFYLNKDSFILLFQNYQTVLLFFEIVSKLLQKLDLEVQLTFQVMMKGKEDIKMDIVIFLGGIFFFVFVLVDSYYFWYICFFLQFGLNVFI